MKYIPTFEQFINEGSMSRTHVVFSMHIETKDRVIYPDFRVTVSKGNDAEKRAISLAQEHFGKDFLKVRSISKAMNPEKYSIMESNYNDMSQDLDENVVNESVWEVDVNEPFNRRQEQRSVQSFKIPQDPIKVREINGQIEEDYTELEISMTNGDNIQYVYRFGGQRELSIYLSDESLSPNSRSINATMHLDRYDGSTNTVTGDILLIYRDIILGKIKIR